MTVQNLTRSSLLLVLFLAAACGGVKRKYTLEQRRDAPAFIEAIHQASLAKGYPSKMRENRSVRFYLNRETRTVMQFVANRQGVVLVIKMSKKISKEEQEKQFQQGNLLAREILSEARGLQAGILERRRVQAIQDEKNRQLVYQAKLRAYNAEQARILAYNAEQARQQAYQNQQARARAQQDAQRRSSAGFYVDLTARAVLQQGLSNHAQRPSPSVRTQQRSYSNRVKLQCNGSVLVDKTFTSRESCQAFKRGNSFSCHSIELPINC